MATYVFESSNGEQVERDFPMGQAPRLVTVKGRKFRKIIAGVGHIIPAYMRAQGSSGSSESACDRQAVYLQSDQHRKDMAQQERIEARNEAAKSRLSSHIKSELGDPKKVAEKVAARTKERQDAGLNI
jgi:hypothetical protein